VTAVEKYEVAEYAGSTGRRERLSSRRCDRKPGALGSFAQQDGTALRGLAWRLLVCIVCIVACLAHMHSEAKDDGKSVANHRA
jgi:hypothetical protein